jgi:hypothetical protein
MTRRLLALILLSALAAAGVMVAARAEAMPLHEVVATIRDAKGHYARGAASLKAADCSGLVSVAQSLAMGEAPLRLGSTRSLLAGQWPHAIRGASPSDAFIIGANRQHMVAQVGGIRLEATCCGRPFLVGDEAASPFAPQFRQWHIDARVLVT